jgi:hypothetical protein
VIPDAYRLDVRVVAGDQVLVERAFDVRERRTFERIDALATLDADQAAAAVAAGHVVVVEVRDPAGDISAAGVWVPVLRVDR